MILNSKFRERYLYFFLLYILSFNLIPNMRNRDHFYDTHRYFDSKLGKFIQPDTVAPTASALDLNRFAYVRNNPIRYNDLSGHVPYDVLDDAKAVLHDIDRALYRAMEFIGHVLSPPKLSEDPIGFVFSVGAAGAGGGGAGNLGDDALRASQRLIGAAAQAGLRRALSPTQINIVKNVMQRYGKRFNLQPADIEDLTGDFQLAILMQMQNDGITFLDDGAFRKYVYKLSQQGFFRDRHDEILKQSGKHQKRHSRERGRTVKGQDRVRNFSEMGRLYEEVIRQRDYLAILGLENPLLAEAGLLAYSKKLDEIIEAGGLRARIANLLFVHNFHPHNVASELGLAQRRLRYERLKIEDDLTDAATDAINEAALNIKVYGD